MGSDPRTPGARIRAEVSRACARGPGRTHTAPTHRCARRGCVVCAGRPPRRSVSCYRTSVVIEVLRYAGWPAFETEILIVPFFRGFSVTVTLPSEFVLTVFLRRPAPVITTFAPRTPLRFGS